MMISTKGRYALRVMIELASHDTEKYIPLKEIAKNQDISEKYLESIIKILVKDGMVIGLRGKGGGYRLSGTPASYTVGKILKLTEGSLAPVWQKLNEIVDNYLESITLEDLAKQTLDNSGGDYII